MRLNWVELAAGILFLSGLVIGVKRGAIRIAVTFAATILTFILTSYATPVIAGVVEKYTPIDEMLGSFVTKDYYDEETQEELKIEEEDQVEAIRDAGFPKTFEEQILKNNNEEGYAKFRVSTFVQYLAKAYAEIVIRMIVFVLLLFTIGILLRAVIFALDVISKIPVLGIVNRMTGGIMGVLISLTILWVLLTLVILFQRTIIGSAIYEEVSNSSILAFLYEHNPVLKIILKI